MCHCLIGWNPLVTDSGREKGKKERKKKKRTHDLFDKEQTYYFCGYGIFTPHLD